MSRKSNSSNSSKGASSDAADKNSASIREFQGAIAENKKCFECDQRGPTYVDMTIGSFVCTKCSGMLRGITPPHRIKSISMSSFTTDEVNFLKSRGNIWCSKVWMGLYDKSRSGAVETKDDDSLKYHIIQKYERKSYYVDPSTIQHSLSSATISNTEVSSAAPNPTAGFIGMTLTHRSNSSTAAPVLSSSVGRPTGSTSSMNASPSLKPLNVPKANGGLPSSTSNGLSGIVLPPPVVDPFSSNASFGATITAPSASATTQQGTNESFANFDSVKFDSVAEIPANQKLSRTGFQTDFLLPNKLPPPPGFKPPVFANKDAPSVVSVLNPVPASTKPVPNYKLSHSPSTKSILRNGSSVKQQSNRVSFDFDDFPKPMLPPKKLNPSMPNLSTKNPFFTYFDEFEEHTDKVAVTLGEKFFNSLFTTNAHITDPWSASKSNNSGFATPASLLTPIAGNGHMPTPQKKTMPDSKKVAEKQASPAAAQMSTEDKYAALKDLDEIFKSTVVMSDGKSTGTSIFGSSASNSTSTLEPSPTIFGGPSPTNNEFQTTSNWGQPPVVDKFESSFGNRGPSPVASAGWAANWPSSNSGSNSTSATSSSKAPINPFTGASNLTQLNTSPWPVTGTSPVQAIANSAASSGWPGVSTMSNASSSNRFEFDAFGSSSHQNHDPFDAAPSANLQTENNNDLFAKAPKPFGSENKFEDQNAISALTQEIFGSATKMSSANNNSNGFSSHSKNMDMANSNPWAFSRPTNQTNPFL